MLFKDWHLTNIYSSSQAPKSSLAFSDVIRLMLLGATAGEGNAALSDIVIGMFDHIIWLTVSAAVRRFAWLEENRNVESKHLFVVLFSVPPPHLSLALAYFNCTCPTPPYHSSTEPQRTGSKSNRKSNGKQPKQGDHPRVLYSYQCCFCTALLLRLYLYNNKSMSLVPAFAPAPRRDWRNMTRTLAHYARIEQIGEGTYGQVYRAKCLDTGRIVALKKIRVHHGGYWGMPPTVIREIKILKKLYHPNLVEMLEVVSSKGVEHLEDDDEAPKQSKNSSNRIVDAREGYKGNIYLVLEYVSHDLTGLMDVAYRFTEQQIKCIFQQLLQALQYMHNQKFIHRDIKSSNILIDSHFCVKLADFGLSRSIEPAIIETIHEYETICFNDVRFVHHCRVLTYCLFCVNIQSRHDTRFHQQGHYAMVSSTGNLVGGYSLWGSSRYVVGRMYLG
jgi:hypothetical protein